MENNKLFNEFPPVSSEKWEEIIQEDLKGADYNKKLVWKTNEGIQVKPYYRSGDIEKLSHLKSVPNEFPYVRGNFETGNNWEIRQDVIVYNIEQANADAIEALNKGASSICFMSVEKINTQDDFSKLLKNIHFGCINFNINSCRNAPKFFNFLVEETKIKAYDIALMKGSIGFNPLGILTNSGNWINSEEEDFKTAINYIEFAAKALPYYRVLNVNGNNFQESGSSIVQEVAFSLAMANEYLSKLTESGLTVDTIAARIQFNLATSSNYFFEIAKIRAFRLLWAKIVEAYHPKSEQSARTFIHSTTAKWNMAVYDAYVNILRSTTETMSAAIGGADSISVKAFDAVYNKQNSFSNRIARNTQIILKEEAYFEHIVDPAAGSYYIENLTDSIAAEAWKLFQIVESNGGYSKSFLKGLIQSEIEKVAQKQLNDFTSRKTTILGVNQYPNFNEQVLKNIDSEVFEYSQNIASTTIAKPLKRFRLAEIFEEVRLKTEKNGQRPKVFMLTIGNLAMRLARSQFSSNFFAVAGFEVIDNNGFKTVDDGVKAAFTANADIIVLCSSDDEYLAFAPEAFEKIGNKAIFVVAGTPACSEDLKSKGIKNFINVKSNILETLKEYQKLLQIV